MTTLRDFERETPDDVDLPQLPNADVQLLDFEREQDRRSISWTAALTIKEGDIEPGPRDGLFDVDDHERCALVVDDDGDWWGFCPCDETDPCTHLCAVRQVTIFDEDLVPEVNLS